MIRLDTSASAIYRVQSHPIVLGALCLLCKAHKEHVRSFCDPFCVQLLLCLRSRGVVGRLQSLQKLRQCTVHFWW